MDEGIMIKLGLIISTIVALALTACNDGETKEQLTNSWTETEGESKEETFNEETTIRENTTKVNISDGTTVENITTCEMTT